MAEDQERTDGEPFLAAGREESEPLHAVGDDTVADDADRRATAADRYASARDDAASDRDRERALPETARALAEEHALAAEDRAWAADDRRRAAGDRARAADDRARAAEDRQQARSDLERAYIDDLTGAATRRIGLLRIQDEIVRAHRRSEPFVLAFVDIDGLKRINDEHGHAAGDAVLRAVGAELKLRLRPYDPIVRVGGDEFLCALSNTTLQAAGERLGEIKAGLRHARLNTSISVGLAELRPGEDLGAVSARSDTALYRAKQARELLAEA